MKARILISLLAAGVAAVATSAQPVQGDVRSAGFATGSFRVVREGQWFPVLVYLNVPGSELFTGTLRIDGVDLDGDRVAFRQPGVTVTPGAGPQRVWCYAITNNAHDEMPPQVDVLDAKGALITKLDMPQPSCMPLLNDDLLVLDISRDRITRLNALATPAWTPGDRGAGSRSFYRNVVVAQMPAADLPDRWWGLEAVNVVIWDRPDPSELSMPQRDALIEWVRNGGQLVIGIGSQWDALRQSDLAPILPLAGAGEVVEIDDLTVFIQRMARPAFSKRSFDSPVAVTTAQPTADAVRILGEYGPRGSLSLITMRSEGSGRVVATAAGIRDLTSIPVDEARFFNALFDLNRLTEEFKKKQYDGMQGMLFQATPLYDDVLAPTGFGGTQSVFGLIAFLFIAGYVVLATIGSWVWLRSRRITSLSWTVFAGFAVVASALGLGTVAGLRGFSRGVQSLNILDLEAGATRARGPVMFGYRSPVRQRVELTLPGDGNFLRPLPRNPKGAGSYVTPARYASIPSAATLNDVLMRATLKQVEGYWHGELDGSIRGQLLVDRGTGRLAPASWIVNDFPVDIEGGVLLFIDPRQEEIGVPRRAANLTTLYDNPPDLAVVPPAMNILAVRLPRIEAGGRADRIGSSQYEKLDTEQAKWAKQWIGKQDTQGNKRKSMPDLSTLRDEHFVWKLSGYGGSGERTVRRLLLACTRNYYLNNSTQNSFDSLDMPLTTAGLPNMDVTHWLLGGRQRGQAVLLCWSPHPGPARLHRNGEPLEAYDGLTLYRVRIPISYQGNPPPRGRDS